MEGIGNPYGVSGLMGNLYAESGLNPQNLQGAYEKKLGMSDEEYTRAVDDGSYMYFISDGAGYGLAQWTYPTRKAALAVFSNKQCKSVGDAGVQLAFLLEELAQSFPSVLKALKAAKSVREASDVVMLEFEKPADTSDAAREKRAAYGEKYYRRFSEVVELPTNHEKYINSTGKHYISNSGHDENNQYHGGQAGDQTSTEYALISWYNRPWTVVLRHPNKEVAMKIAKMAIDAALNNNIGYDQYQRNTMWRRLCEVGYEPAKITTPCEADCTASTTAIVKSVGVLLEIKVLADIELDTYSRNMKVRFVAAGFKALTASKYLTGYEYLEPGDILLYEGHHAAINVTRGKYANVDGNGVVVDVYKLGDRLLKNGMKGTDVEELQKALLDLGYNLGKWGIDGDFGDCTEMAVRQFQTQLNLKVDGKVGTNTVAALKAAIAAASSAVINPTYVVIVGGSCYVRETPRVEDGNIMGVAIESSKLAYGGKTTDNGWHMVSYKERTGYVSGKYGRLVK